MLSTAALGSGLLLAACESADESRGRRLYAGELPLQARIGGHVATLPSHASRCINCHVDTGASATGAPASAQGFGGPMSGESLSGMRPRRGGPPSRFDESSLCRLLRTGVDPAYVVIPRSMPRYDVSDADCRALWARLSRRKA